MSDTNKLQEAINRKADSKLSNDLHNVFRQIEDLWEGAGLSVGNSGLNGFAKETTFRQLSWTFKKAMEEAMRENRRSQETTQFVASVERLQNEVTQLMEGVGQ